MGLFGEPWQDESQRLGHSGLSVQVPKVEMKNDVHRGPGGARTALLEE